MVGEYQQDLLKGENIDNGPRVNLKGKRLPVLLVGASFLLALACAAHFVTPRVAQVDGALQFNVKADIRSSLKSAKYYWPSARGNVGSYTKSPYPAVFDLRKPSWTWSYNCCFGCTWCAEMVGVVLDEHKHIYLTATDGIRKFSSTGRLLWRNHRKSSEVHSKVSALLDGAVHAISKTGRAFALDMYTGQELWSTKLADDSAGNYGQVAAQHGVAIHPAETDESHAANTKLFGVNSTDGRILWVYVPDPPVWNFGATFPGDGTFAYQTLDGQVHRNSVNTGASIWKAGGIPGSWTDGQSTVGSNGVLYAVANYGLRSDWGIPRQDTGIMGCLSAHSLTNGHLIWRRNLTKPPNSIPAVGVLAGSSKLSVVIPVGINGQKDAAIDVIAFDAASGEDQWVFKGPVQLFKGPVQLAATSPSDGNPEAIAQRLFNWVPPGTYPNSWGTPAIDGNGAVFVGGCTGHLFRLQDLNQDGEVAGHAEVAKMTTDADFVGSSSPAIAPGLFAIGNSHKLFVWNEY